MELQELSSLTIVRVLAATGGAICVAAGAVAVFATDNGAGSGALLALGGVLVILAFLGERIESLEFGSLKVRVAKELTRLADEAEEQGDVASAERLRARAAALAETARPIASQYETLRRSLPAGLKRTGELERLVAEAKKAAEPRFTRDELRDLFFNDGARIFALGVMHSDPRVADFEVAKDAIERSRSAFEQYHGLRLAGTMVPRLTVEERQILVEILRTNPWLLEADDDRPPLRERLLTQLETDSG